jgi:hypothetical protein
MLRFGQRTPSPLFEIDFEDTRSPLYSEGKLMPMPALATASYSRKKAVEGVAAEKFTRLAGRDSSPSRNLHGDGGV